MEIINAFSQLGYEIRRAPSARRFVLWRRAFGEILINRWRFLVTSRERRWYFIPRIDKCVIATMALIVIYIFFVERHHVRMFRPSTADFGRILSSIRGSLLVLFLSFLCRWQVKRPIRAGQRGRRRYLIPEKRWEPFASEDSQCERFRNTGENQCVWFGSYDQQRLTVNGGKILR